jgi:myo-inositol-1(or 4)-monophosphatase
VTLVKRPWDTAAGVVIAREAGATVIDDDRAHAPGPTATIAGPASLIAQLASLVHAMAADPQPVSGS